MVDTIIFLAHKLKNQNYFENKSFFLFFSLLTETKKENLVIILRFFNIIIASHRRHKVFCFFFSLLFDYPDPVCSVSFLNKNIPPAAVEKISFFLVRLFAQYQISTVWWSIPNNDTTDREQHF